MKVTGYKTNKYSLIAFILLSSFGATFVGMGIYSLYHSISVNWTRQATGVIIKSAYSVNLSYGSTNYTPIIKYRYFVDGKEFINDKIDTQIGTKVFYTKERIFVFLAQHPEKKTIRVYYDITNPKNSFLYQEVGFGTLSFIFFGAVFIWVGFKIFRQNKI